VSVAEIRESCGECGLKQIAPSVARVAVIRDAALTSGTGQWAAIQVVASSYRIELSPIGLHDSGEIESGISEFARGTGGGVIVTSSTLAIGNRKQIIDLAARHRLPAVYSYRFRYRERVNFLRS
jgi:putative ABC transport system substrate-binding protein